MKKYILVLLSLLSGILLWLSWYPNGIPFLSFIALVPLLIISDEILKYKLSFWQGMLYSFPAFFVWNAATTWWIWNSTPPGAVAALFLNSLFMSMIFGLWQLFKKRKPSSLAVPLAFIAFWCSWEFLHLHWDISWPWLNLGNLFAPVTGVIQWYEYTGTFGGTIWILGANFLFYYFIRYIRENRKKGLIYAGSFAAWLIIPITISLIIYKSYDFKRENPIDTVVVQQNTDPWHEQYRMSNTDHVIRILKLATPYIDQNTGLVICPESAIPHSVSGKALLDKTYPPEDDYYFGFVLLDTLFHRFPHLNMITGLSTYNWFDNKIRPTAREVAPGKFLEMYNTAACINIDGVTELYYKSKLVPGVELMPYPALFGFLEKLIIDLGGPSGSLGIDTMQRAFRTTLNGGTVKVGSPVCYESIYGELFGRFIKDGAQVMSVITNDAWWNETPGHRQHFIYSRLRAVETRRTILRAANTGISAVIDERGDVLHQTKYGERTVIKTTVYPNDQITFYVKYGDYLARFALGISVLMLLYLIVLWITNRRNRIR